MAVAQKHFYPGGRKIFYFVSFYPAPFSEFDADINIKTLKTMHTLGTQLGGYWTAIKQ